MLQGGLQTALESQVIVFEVAGVSERQHPSDRPLAPSCLPSAVDAGELLRRQPEFRMPESIWRLDDHVREKWFKALDAAHEAYRAACEADASYQDARYILPEGTTNYILCEYTLESS
jgi:hypothetical protein